MTPPIRLIPRHLFFDAISSRCRALLILFALLSAFSELGYAKTCTWTATSGTWSAPTNWTNGAVPTSLDTALINNGGTLLVPAGVSGTADTLVTGSSGLGAVTLNGGSLLASYAYLGYGAGSRGMMNVNSGTWRHSSDFYVGYQGAATESVTGGEVQHLGVVFLGYQAGSSGTETVNGGIVRFYDYGVCQLGTYGLGVLNIDGGTISRGYFSLGETPSSKGIANMISGTWAAEGIYVGTGGSGVLTITGGTVTSNDCRIGDYSGTESTYGDGTATISGGSFSIRDSLSVGESGTGALKINGGSVTSQTASIGRFGRGSVTVSSGTWVNTSALIIAPFGLGAALTVTGGAVTTGSSVYLAESGIATATVSGGSWTLGSQLYVGYYSTASGALNISGGIVTGSSALIGCDGSGTVTVSSGTWATTNDVFVGWNGTGLLQLTGNGKASIGAGAGRITLAASPGSTGTLRIGTGGAPGTLSAAVVTGGPERQPLNSTTLDRLSSQRSSRVR